MHKLLSQHLLCHFVKTNDEKALRILRERHEEKLIEWVETHYRAGTWPSATAANVVNEIFIAVRDKCREYDETKPFSEWLYRTAADCAVNCGMERRSRKSDHWRTGIVNRLPELERRALTLLLLDGQSLSVAAKQLKVSDPRLRAAFNSALAKLECEWRLSA